MSNRRNKDGQLAAPSNSESSVVLPGFEKIGRYWDQRNRVHVAKIMPGEYYVTTKDEMITTVLGSCISACIRDPVTGVGGMNHFMLPEHIDGASEAWEVTPVNSGTRYGTFAMEHLINEILKNGGEKNRLETKVFGGGRVLNLSVGVGDRNIEFVLTYLEKEGLKVTKIDVGDDFPRKVNYFPKTGRAMVKKMRSTQAAGICEREREHLENLEHKVPLTTDIELF